MTDGGELLRRYVEETSQGAFTEVVQRLINTVHAIAMRRSNGDSLRAADVTQKVFVSLAHHAGELSRHPALAGWLYTSTRYAVLDLLRSERRRLRREGEAMAMRETEFDPGELNDELLLDALDQLSPRDREVVVLRFSQGCGFRQIGVTLRLTEDAARMRVDRALARLRSRLGPDRRRVLCPSRLDQGPAGTLDRRPVDPGRTELQSGQPDRAAAGFPPKLRGRTHRAGGASRGPARGRPAGAGGALRPQGQRDSGTPGSRRGASRPA